MKLSVKKNINVPNTLTALRLVLIIPLLHFLLKQEFVNAGIIILVSAMSDMMDGFLARRLNQVTSLGKILDPIADKLTLIAVVIGINVIYPEVMPFVIVLFTKELLMLAGGAFLLKLKIRPPAARWYGKLSTVLFYTSITTLIMLKAIWGYTNGTLSLTLLAVTTTSMLFSLVMYSLLFGALVRERNRAETAAQEEPAADEAEDID